MNRGWDAGTDRLTELLSAALERELGRPPYVVMARFNRAYIDANRPPEDAFEHPLAEPYYRAYHDAIMGYVGEIQARWERGVLLDLHGYRIPNQIHLGTRDGRTVANLLAEYGAGALQGPNSIYGGLRSAGYDVRPPPGEPEYWPGGYTPDIHGTLAGGLDAMQLEIGLGAGSRATDEEMADLAQDLAAALAAFHDAYLPLAERRDGR